MAKDLVELSIIVPIYNTGKFLKRCLESIKKQSFQDWEALLIDDGSTDNSPLIIDSFCKTDSRYKAFHLSNHGVSFARNYGISVARGKYITFVDSDDYFDQDMLMMQMKKMVDYNSDIIQCNFVDSYPNGEFEYHGVKNDYLLTDKESIIKEFFLGNLNSSVCTKIYSKKTIDNYRFLEDIRVGEDMLFNIYVCLNAKRIALCNDNTYFYVIHNESVMHGVVDTKRMDVFKVFEMLKKQFKGSYSLVEYILVGEIKELITLINLLVCEKNRKKSFKDLRKLLISDYKLVRKSILSLRQKTICRAIHYFPTLYSFAVRLRKSKKN